MLAAVSDADLGEASGINDAASRVGGVIVIALVPVLIGATGGRGYAHALVHGYQPAMIVMGALCAAAALVTALFVTDARTAHRVVPRTPAAGCAPPVPAHAAGSDPSPVPSTGGPS